MEKWKADKMAARFIVHLWTSISIICMGAALVVSILANMDLFQMSLLGSKILVEIFFMPFSLIATPIFFLINRYTLIHYDQQPNPKLYYYVAFIFLGILTVVGLLNKRASLLGA